ncbi:uncharacterized protein [Paralichthys olivaceus]|uniref:uncharacterized protein n=1 Tax=Paralichthys olivaceus TaxID=8255 RepID=UPI0037516867
MMRMSGRLMSCSAALFLALASVSAIQKLNSIDDLKKINFGQSVPKHTLLLLHWFANVVDIDSNNIIQLTFDPDDDDYGSHHYGNFDRLLQYTPYSCAKYYTVGNILLDGHEQLPDYVTRPRAGYEGGNMDRIIFRVRQQNEGWQTSQQIDQVYITQHYGIPGNKTYDPDHTYEITTNLLRQIRDFSVGENQQSLQQLRNHYGSNISDLSHIRNIWGDLACLGLLLFIVIQERHNYIQQSASLQSKTRTNTAKVTTQPHFQPPHFQPPNFQQPHFQPPHFQQRHCQSARQNPENGDISTALACFLFFIVVFVIILIESVLKR